LTKLFSGCFKRSGNQKSFDTQRLTTMKFINLNRKLFLGIVVLATVGVVLSYYAAHRESKPTTDPVENKHFNDSVTTVNSEIISGKMGAKPESDLKDGLVKIVKEFVKSHTQNPNTFQFLEWSEISSEGGYWKVRCKYTGASSFDKEVTTNAWFYIQNNKVVYTKIISKI